MRRFIDAGVNLSDKMFAGVYNGKVKHPEDVERVLARAFRAGVERLVLLSGSLGDSRDTLKLADRDQRLAATVGCHPTNCGEFVDRPDEYLASLRELAAGDGRVVAIGECGLDYDRLNFCSESVQKQYFEKQVELAVDLQLPLYLHCRASHDDLIEILKRHYQRLPSGRPGLVHTYDGSPEHARQLLDMGFYLGINGGSLKTQSNLETVSGLPLDRMVLETDAPWCEVRPSHAGYKHIKTFVEANKKEKWNENRQVKSRNEPENVVQIYEIICAIREECPDLICRTLFENCRKLFGLSLD